MSWKFFTPNGEEKVIGLSPGGTVVTPHAGDHSPGGPDAIDSVYVDRINTQAIGGVKTFTDSPVVQTGSNLTLDDAPAAGTDATNRTYVLGRTLDEFADVDYPLGTTIGDVLTWDGFNWVPGVAITNEVFAETPTGLIDSANTVYTTANNFLAGTLRLYLDGIRMVDGATEDYTITGVNQATFNFAPLAGQVLRADYKY